MIEVKRAASWGTALSNTLAVRCHFAFANANGPAQKQGGWLRALNKGQLEPAQSYHVGPEANVDIVTWLQTGSLTAQMDGFAPQGIAQSGLHLASTGRGCTGVVWQAGPEGAVFYQIWFLAATEGTNPEQESRPAQLALEDGGFKILASGFPEDDPEEAASVADGAPITLSSRARLLHALLPAGEGAAYCTTLGRTLVLLVVTGSVTLGAACLQAGDTATLTHETDLTAIAQSAATLLLIDVPCAEKTA